MADTHRKAVLITGTSSGIGRACVRRLSRAGTRVFAGVRRAADADSLRCEDPDVVPFLMDVTDAASIQAAAQFVGAELRGAGLDGLVNNAGTGLSAPMEYVPLEMLRHELEVNVIGQIAVTQAFLPAIRRARGRIVNIGSVGARLAMPFGGVLCGGKSALAAMTDALRLELHPFGIHVSLIEPAAIRTPAIDKTLGDVERTLRALPGEAEPRYGAMLREFNRLAFAREEAGTLPHVVARTVQRALTARRPRARYPVGKNARMLVAMPRLLPDRLLDWIRLRLFRMPNRFGALRA
jgi:NAD(P)-dependent dehydrogenase (short-subunit alcohol dehydrogenase family)